MKLVVLSCGAVVAEHNNTRMLFGAPMGVKEQLDTQGLEVPDVVMLTSMRAPGFGRLGKPVLRYKEQRLAIDDLVATPVKHTHGTDYTIEAPNARILFSERGDVSLKDVEGFNLAIIKNKHRSDGFGVSVVTWPWPDVEYTIVDSVATPTSSTSLKEWSSAEDMPDNLKSLDGAPLSLAQANAIARVAIGAGEGGKENWAIGISQFKKAHTKTEDGWVAREKEELRSKDEVDYRVAEEPARLCGVCVHYQGGRCELVAGKIDEDYVCDLFEASTSAGQDLFSMLGPGDGVLAPEMMTKEAGRTVRFGDVLVAALHTAYNDTADRWYSLGYMDDSQRKAIGQSIGEALKALRASAPIEVMDQQLPADPMLVLPKELKELSPELPNEVGPGWSAVFKDNEGNWRWAAVTTTVTLDDHTEVITPRAIDWAIKFNEIVGTKGPLRFRHIPGLDGGDCTHQLRVGDYLFEAGTFRDNAVGLAMRQLLQNNTGLWKMSPGLLYAPKDLMFGVFFKRMMLFERSATPWPANKTTAILAIKEGDTMALQELSAEQLKEAAEQLQMPVDQVTALYKAAQEAGGNPMKSIKEFVEIVEKEKKAAGPPPYVKDDGEDDDTEEMMDEEETKENLAEVIATLNKDELLQLKELVAAAESKAQPTLPNVYEEIRALKEAVATTSTQLKELVTALAQRPAAAPISEDAATAAIRQALQSQPRAAFATRQKETPDAGAGAPTEDAAVQAILNKVQTQLKEQSDVRGQGFYGLFTSQTLNRGRGSRQRAG